MRALTLFIALSMAYLMNASTAQAATATGNFTSQITITGTCIVETTNTLDFGSNGVLTANINVTATFDVLCANTVPYDVGLNEGTTVGGTTTTRLMVNGVTTVSYQMYSNAGRTTNWGNAVGTDTVAGTGNGSTQTLTIYGRVPPQTSVAPATYTDLVTVTITY